MHVNLLAREGLVKTREKFKNVACLLYTALELFNPDYEVPKCRAEAFPSFFSINKKDSKSIPEAQHKKYERRVSSFKVQTRNKNLFASYSDCLMLGKVDAASSQQVDVTKPATLVLRPAVPCCEIYLLHCLQLQFIAFLGRRHLDGIRCCMKHNREEGSTKHPEDGRSSPSHVKYRKTQHAQYTVLLH